MRENANLCTIFSVLNTACLVQSWKFTSFVSWTGSGLHWVGRTPLPKFLLSTPHPRGFQLIRLVGGTKEEPICSAGVKVGRFDGRGRCGPARVGGKGEKRLPSFLRRDVPYHSLSWSSVLYRVYNFACLCLLTKQGPRKSSIPFLHHQPHNFRWSRVPSLPMCPGGDSL